MHTSAENIHSPIYEPQLSLNLDKFSGTLQALVQILISEQVFKTQSDLDDFAAILWQAHPIFMGDTAEEMWDGDFDQGRQFIQVETTRRFKKSIDIYNIFEYKRLPPMGIPELYQNLKPLVQ